MDTSSAVFNAIQTQHTLKLHAQDVKAHFARNQTKWANTRDFTKYLRYESDYSSRWDDKTSDDQQKSIHRELRRILESPPTAGNLPEPSQIAPRVYLGSVSHAENTKLLKRLGITHVLNCAGIASIRTQREARYGYDTGIECYEELPAEDTETYDITHHFAKANRFIDLARQRGRVLVYCPDVNRSGAIAIGYLLNKGEYLLQAARVVKDKRKGALFNRGFMAQLVSYAKDYGLLERNVL